MLVFVLNKHKKPLMPCSSAKARRLLKEGKATVVRKYPFTIKLTYGSTGFKQDIVAGMDSGSKVIGTAAVTNNKIVYLSETHLRGEEIKSKMEQRRMYRRGRRGRKTRYRRPKFLNRKAGRKLNRLPPSTKHKVNAHLREKKHLESILPITKWNVETASFDIHKITNPNVSKKHGHTYQQGQKLGFYNTKAFVLSRDQHSCQKCKKHKDGLKLHVHHIKFKSNGGTDSPNNLITLCEHCHSKVHLHPKATTESLKLQKKLQKSTKHATEISILRSQLLKSFGDFEETYGYITKFNRENAQLSKTHYNDAAMIASQGNPIVGLQNFFLRRLVSKGDYQQTKGVRSEKKIPTGKVYGLRKFDYVSTSKGQGYIKGKRSSGYFALSNIIGKTIHASVNIKKSCTRIAARKLLLTKMEIVLC